LLSRKAGKHLGFMGIAKVVPEDLGSLRELIEAGKVRPFVEKEYTLSAAVDAFRYFGEGHARGKVVVTVGPSS
jgi:NADPH:quinone reductase-like Zn-dependent oxidoreductase